MEGTENKKTSFRLCIYSQSKNKKEKPSSVVTTNRFKRTCLYHAITFVNVPIVRYI